MALALRPVVVLMAVASVLFVAAGILDGVYPGGPHGDLDSYRGLGWATYVFAAVNAFVAVLIARGSERTLALRIALSAFFLVERPVSAFLLGPKSVESIAVHLVTAVVELVILLGAVRVWQLGHSYGGEDLDALLGLDGPAASRPVAAAGPQATAERSEPTVPRSGPAGTWLIGLLTLLLAAVLVADGILSGFVPGGREWGLVGETTGWLTYLFAVVVLVVAVRAVHGGAFALRVLLVLALILFVERAFSPFALATFEPLTLGLHVLAAFVALALALASVAAIRSNRRLDGVAEPHGA